ncbi:putative T6SS immunity periplasmic lipoprotein [Pseudomonas cerasi]
MTIKKARLPLLISALLTGCGWMGHYSPPNELGQVSRTDAGMCFQIENAGDYYAHYLVIRDSRAPEMSGFKRKLPALKITNDQLCIPETYYTFPDSGAKRVDIALRLPTRKMRRRYIVSEFNMVNGEPHPFVPSEYSIPLPDVVD